MNDEPPKASTRNEQLPEALDAVTSKAMAKEPAQRYRSATELVDAIQQVTAAPKRRLAKRPVAMLLGLLAVIVAAAAVAAVLLTGGGDDGGAVGDAWSRVVPDQAAFAGSSEVLAVGLAAGEPGLVAVGTDGVGTDGVFPETDAAVWISPDGVSWTRARDFDLRGQGSLAISGVALGETGFVAVGFQFTGDPISDNPDNDLDAAVWTSPAGQSWERVVDPEGVLGGPPHEVVRDGERLVVPSWQVMRDVVVGGPGFVAVGGDNFAGSDDEARGAVWTSPDGQSWSRVPDDAQVFGSRQAERGSVELLGVAAAADGRLVAVGLDALRNQEGSLAGVVLLSADGVSWTRAPHDEAVFASESSDTVIADVVAGGRGFVAVGSEATPAGSVFLVDPVVALQEARRQRPTSLGEVRGVAWTSRDGLAWSRVPEERLPDLGEANVQLHAVTTGGPGLVAVGRRESDRVIDPVVWTSPDGETWSPAADLEEALRQTGGQLMTDVIEAGPGLVAVGADGSIAGVNAAVWTSP